MRFGRRYLHGSARSTGPAWLFLPLGLTLACGSEGGNAPVADDEQGVTWNRDVAPFVAKKCGTCHREGGIGPMALDDYATAKHFGARMLEEVTQGNMPPWSARTTDECSPAFGFKDDPRLTPSELESLESWVDGGMLEGKARTSPLPVAPARELTDATLHLTIPSAASVSGNEDRFVCFTLDPGTTEDEYIDASQVNPGNDEIVHHVLIFSDPEGEGSKLANADGQYECFGGPGLTAGKFSLIGAWAPGAVPAVMPKGVGLGLPARSKLVMQVHYHSHADVHDGTDASTSVDLRFAKSLPSSPGSLALVGNFAKTNVADAGGNGYGLQPGMEDPSSGPAFVIPAGSKAHVETLRFKIPRPEGDSGFAKGYRIWGIGTHMHYVGRDMKIEVTHEDGSKECLLQTPDWDFNWQRLYYYDTELDAAPLLRIGDSVEMRCEYDNSMDNAGVKLALTQQGLKAPIDVSLGETTLDEMCLGVFGVALEAGF